MTCGLTTSKSTQNVTASPVGRQCLKEENVLFRLNQDGVKAHEHITANVRLKNMLWVDCEMSVYSSRFGEVALLAFSAPGLPLR